ncbi:MAG: enoyl-CoA hydratase/isomerase family protein [bacterium]
MVRSVNTVTHRGQGNNPGRELIAPITVITRKHWTEVVLDRPPRNVLDQEMLTALVATLTELGDDTAPLLLLRAAGRHFSTGYSIGDIPEAIFHRDPAVRAGSLFEQLMARLTHYPAPVVAAVQGDAWGGAVEMLACCDIRTAVEGVRLAVPSVRLGLVYSHTGIRRLIRGFGSPLARELLFTGDTITAQRAERAGFFSRVVPAEELPDVTEVLLRSLARGGPFAVRGTRRVFTLLDETESLSDDMLAEIAAIRHESWCSDEFALAREAFVAGRPSPFIDPPEERHETE